MGRINTLDQYIAATKQRALWLKTATRTTVAAIPFTMMDIAGNPGAGVLDLTGQTNGQKQTDAIAGYPAIQFTSGECNLTKVEFGNSVLSRLEIYDCLVKHGPVPYTAGTINPTGQPAISDRCPDYPGSGSVFGVNNEIWVEVSLGFSTGTAWQIQVTYTNSAGTGGRTTVISASQAAAALTLGKCFQLALQAGDQGVQKIDSITVTNGGTAMTAGRVNVMIMRPLWTMGRVGIANGGDIHDMIKTGMPVIYHDTALYPLVRADSTSSGLPEIVMEVSSI